MNGTNFVNTPAAYHSKTFLQLGTSGADLAFNVSVSGVPFINYAMPGQYAGSNLIIGNNGTTTFSDLVLCDKVDNTRTTVVDPATVPGTLSPGILPAVQGLFGWFKPNASTSVPLNAAQTPAFVVEYGIGGVGGVGNTWASYNTVTAPTTNPSGASAQGSGSCADGESTGSTWYSLNDLRNDTIPGGAQAITKVRVKVASLAPNQQFSFFLPFVVRSTYAFSGTDLAPGGAFSAGDPTTGAFVPNRSSIVFPGVNGGNPLFGSDALKIQYLSQLSLSKSVAPAGPVQPGTVVRYYLSPGFSTPTYPQSETITFTDDLPAGVTYLPGSSRYAGSPTADPTIQPDTPSAGLTRLTWSIPGVSPAHTPAAGNIGGLTFDAQLGFQFAQGQLVTNNASVASTTGAQGSGAVANTIDAPAGLRFSKATSTPNVERGQPLRYSIAFSASSITPLNFELIDVLPYNGDGRTPPSAVTGSFSNVVVTPDAANPPPASNLRYTRNTPASINTNPYAAGAHSKNGSGTNSASLTVWCAAAQFGSGDCPASMAQVTAFLLAMHPFDASGNPQGSTPLPTGTSYDFGIELTPTGNAYGNVYTNQARAASSDSSLAPISSPFATVNVVPASIAGVVYNDANRSGTQDPGESGIGGVTIALACTPALGGPPLNLTTTTAADGTYSFASLPSGSCTLTQTQPADTFTTFNTPGTSGGTAGAVGGATEQITGITLVTGANATGYNFGEATPSAAINLTKTVNGAPAPANWSFTLATSTPGCAIPATTANPATTPGSGGTAAFAGLQVWSQSTPNTHCAYSISENTQNGWIFVPGSSTALTGITLNLGQTANVSLVNAQQTAEIAVTKTVNGAAAPANWSFTLSSSVAGCAIPGATTNPATTPGSGGAVSFANLPVASSTSGAACTYAITENSQTGYLLNTGTSSALTGITVVAGATTPVTINNDQVRVRVQKTLTSGVIAPGNTVVYSVVVTNAGTVAAAPVAVSDPIPAGLTTPFTWTCAASAGSGACGAASGSGALATTANLPAPNDAVTYTISATVGATPPASVNNTATITPPGAGACAGPCSSTVASGAVPVINVHKSTSSSTVTPGGTTTFTVAVTNSSATAASNVALTDPIGPGFSAYAWTCAGSGGGVCPSPSGSGAISQTLPSLPAGATLTYTISATALADPPATVVNTFTATPPSGSGAVCAGGNPPPCSSSVSLPAAPVVEITKTTATPAATPGGTASYTISVNNTGASAANNTVVGDPLPTGVTAFTWTCAATGGAACPNASGSGAIEETIATLPSGGSVVYTVTATFAASLPATVVNTATAAPPPGGICSDGSAPPCAATATIAAVPVVQIAKTSGATPITAGATVTYQVVVSNEGSVAANGVAVDDAIPAGLTTPFSWTCATSAGSGACVAASGSGAISTTANLPAPGDAVTYTITATVGASPPSTVTNTATVTPPGGGVCNGPCSASASNSTVDVTLAKSAADADANGLANPGDQLIYTITLSNAGGAAATDVSVTETVPVGTTYVGTGEGWSCTGTSAGSTCTQVVASVPPGTATATRAFTVRVDDPLAPTLASIDNVVVKTGDTPPPCPGADPRCASLPAGAVVSLVKSVAESVAVPGGTLTYTLLVGNASGVAAGSTTLADPLPAGVSAFSWTCAASGGAVCPTAGGSGAISEVVPNLPVGGLLTYTVTATVAANPPASIANTATITPPAGATCDNGECTATATVGTAPVVRVEKSTGALAVVPNSTVTYTVTVTNTGAAPADGTSVHDTLPADFASANWTCASSGGAVCPNAGGSGSIDETIAVLPAGGVVTYTITAVATATPSPTVVNTATVTPPPNGECDGGECSASTSTPAGALTALTVTKDDGATSYEPGGTATYTIVVTNAGPSTADNVAVNDAFPAGVTLTAAVTCTPAGAAACGTITGAAGASGFGVVGATIAAGPGNGVTYTVPVAFASTMTVNPLVNTVTASAPSDADGASASDSDALGASSDVAIVKSGPPNVAGGAPITYTLTLSNAGPSSADGTTYLDNVPASITGVTASCGNAQGGAACSAPSLAGNSVSGSVPVLPAGGSVEITISGIAPAGTQTLVNSASVTAPAGTTDPNSNNNTSTVSTSTPVTLLRFEIE